MAEGPKLTAEQRQKIADWLNQKWQGGKHCNICGQRTWVVGEQVVTPVNVTGGGVFFGGQHYPMAVVTCGNCGNTHFFNAVVMGLVNQEEPKEEKKQTKEGGAENAS